MAGIKHKTCLRQYFHCGPSVEKKIETIKEIKAKKNGRNKSKNKKIKIKIQFRRHNHFYLFSLFP